MMSSSEETQISSNKQPANRRTNSLAFAKTDCHSCSDLKRWCDRQRPQCGPCVKHRQKCGGYIQDLTWKHHSVSEGRRHANKNTCVDIPAPGSPEGQGAERQFKFKQGHPRKKRKHNAPSNTRTCVVEDHLESHMSQSPSSRNAAPLNTGFSTGILQDLVDLSAANKAEASSQSVPPTPELQNWPTPPLWTAYDDGVWPSGLNSIGDFVPSPQFPEVPDHYDDSFSFGVGTGTDTTSSTDSPDSDFYHSGQTEFRTGSLDMSLQAYRSPGSSLLQGVLYNDLHHKFSPVLALYDQDFCVIPLTMDCIANPFRVRKESAQGSKFLLHAILALSMQHLAKQSRDENLATEMLVHRSTATHLYSEALSSSTPLALLDTLLIMMNLDVTQSASGPWDVHLLGALKLLESAGGVEVCKESSRRRAQLAMLVWWDVTIAFISRQEPLFPLSYLESLLDWRPDDGWTFFRLNGCPGRFIFVMAQLTKLASVYEKVASLNCEWTTFSLQPVQELVLEMQNWENEDDCKFQDLEDLEDTDARRNRYHCSESWRQAIILYTLRVFTPKQDQRGLQSISFLARVILDHIRCIKDDDLIQKQVLIPIFLAAAEVWDESDRSFIRQYCKNWSSRSRYFMFETAQTIIEQIWSGWDLRTRDVYWWGSVVGGGSWSQSRRENPMRVQYLLG